MMTILMLTMAPIADAKGGGGGGRASSGGRVSTSRTNTPSKPSAPSPAKTITKTPPKTIQSTKPVVSSTGKKMNGTGKVVDENYQPKFRSGYVAPAGSVVYYPERSILDWLPFYMIMTHQQHQQVVVQSPDGNGGMKEETQEEEGTDGMYIFNWIFSILVVGGVIYLIMRLVNRRYGTA